MHYLLLAWDVKNIAEQCNVSLQTVYTVENNLMRYGSLLQAWPRAKAFKDRRNSTVRIFDGLRLTPARRDGVLALAQARGFG
jgi:hypothetical protein